MPVDALSRVYQARLERTATSQKAIDRLFADLGGRTNLRVVLAYIDPGPSVPPQSGPKKQGMRMVNRTTNLAETMSAFPWQASPTGTKVTPTLAVGGEPAFRQPSDRVLDARLDETQPFESSELPLPSQSQSQVLRPANGNGTRKRGRPKSSTTKSRARARAKTHAKSAADTRSAAATADQDASSSEDEDVLIYQSKVGDTVQKVATVFKVDVQDLIRTNAKRFPGVSKLNLRYTPLSWYHKGIPAPTSLGPDGPLWEYRNCKTEACLALEFV